MIAPALAIVLITAASAGPAAAAIEGGDTEVVKLLETNPGAGAAENLAYIHNCEQAGARFPHSPMIADLCKRIGDGYYEVNRLRYAGQWNRWYRRAAAANPALEHDSPIGYRLREYSAIAMRRSVVGAALSADVLLVLLLLLRGVRCRWSFDRAFFVKRLAVFFVIYALSTATLLFVDMQIFSRSAIARGTEGPITNIDFMSRAVVRPTIAFVKPVIPLSVMDPSSARRGGVIFALGFLPILFALVYASFARRYSRVALCAAVVVAALSIWTHFLTVTGSDESLRPKVAVTGMRVLYRGEPEELLARDPQKALRANPRLLKSDNPDLREFLEQHYPHGIPSSAQ